MRDLQTVGPTAHARGPARLRPAHLRPPLVAVLVRAAAVAMTLAFAASRLPGIRDHVPLWLLASLTNGVYAAGTALAVLRVALVRVHRAPWVLMAAAMGSYTLATVYSWVVTLRGGTLPFPSLADLGWLLIYPPMYAGIVVVLYIESRHRTLTLLDGAIAGLGGAAVFSQLELGVLIDPAGRGHGIVALITLAYPLGDSLLVATVLCVITVAGKAARGRLGLLCLGLTCFAAADTAYVTLVSRGEYTLGNSVDILYLVGLTLIGVSAWQRAPAEAPPISEGKVQAALPIVFAVGALALLVFSRQGGIEPVTAYLAGCSLVIGLVRGAISIRLTEAVSEIRHREARRDDLTGLANRRAYEEYLADRLAERPAPDLAVLLLDLDRFKDVNDSFGHHVGDRLLREAAARLRQAVRRGDFLARLGGDEFVVVAGPALSEEELNRLARRLREELRAPFEFEGVRAQVDVSIGIAASAELAGDAGLLLQHADIAMYAAKKSRDGHDWYRDNSDVEQRHRLELLDALRRDVGTGAIVLHYQPKLELRTGAVIGVEALVRWQHPTEGLLYPDTFLPLAEQAWLMAELTTNVMGQAIRQCVDWRAAGMPLSVAVNVSSSDLSSPAFPEQVAGMLHRAGLPAAALIVEVTETVMMDEDDYCWVVIEQLGALGVGVSIDDYGTDYASLTYLQRLRSAAELKLDRRFVSQVDSDQRSATIVRSTIDLAHLLGMAVVAEGVETAPILGLLTNWGCDLAQGYHISRPKPAADLTEWLLAGAGVSVDN
jgi:diguanylate cyclase